MLHALINTTNENLIYGSVAQGSTVILYDSINFDVYSGFDNILKGLKDALLESDNLAYQMYIGAIVYTVNGSVYPRDDFFSWVDAFKIKYEYYNQFKASGFSSVKLDATTNQIILGTRVLNIDDIPNGIPVSKIGEGDITNLEFSTLTGINPSLSIQAQLDSKANANHNHTYTFILSTPSSQWTINHSLGVRPQVELFDSQYNLVLATVEQPDINTVRIRFSSDHTCIANLTI